MELTKKDLRQIESETSDVCQRIEAEASEYANLYKRTYYETLAEKLKTMVEINRTIEDYSKNK